MHVGVFLADKLRKAGLPGLPHARGGVSLASRQAGQEKVSSPCTWGCFPHSSIIIYRELVFPMHVGVFLADKLRKAGLPGLPHARGGVSSNRIWQSTKNRVFPMHVGVFPGSRKNFTIEL